MILMRDRGVCQLRIEGVCTGRATCVHHTRGRAITGDDPRYMVAACEGCNLQVGQPELDPRPRGGTTW